MTTAQKMKDADLSKLHHPNAVKARLKKAATRINGTNTVTTVFPPTMSAEPKPKTKIAKRVREQYEATPPANDLWERPRYVLGDGDPDQPFQRPGSDHSHIKSFGDRT